MEIIDRSRFGGLALVLLLAASTAAPGCVAAQATPRSRVEVRTHTLPEAPGVEIPYGVYVPTTYDPSRPTPLVIALHGLGSDEMYMMDYGTRRTVPDLAEQYGYLVATPLGYDQRGWYGSRGSGNEFNRSQADPGPANLGELSEKDVLAVLAVMKRDFHVDEDRTYLIGQSMGGGGTWHIGMKYPDVWAAIAPMAPAIYSSPDALASVRGLPPVMVVMGDADELVDVNVTRRWVAKLRELGLEHEYIEVPGGTHASAGRDNIEKVFAFLSAHRR